MKKKYNLEEIRKFWADQAKKYGQSHTASWSDQPAIDLEIRTILKYIDDGNKVFDAGCANGYSTIIYALSKNIFIKGSDYIPEMIEQACERLTSYINRLNSKVSFSVGNVLGLEEPDNLYDKVIVTRVLINLVSWENQYKAIQECGRILKPGGKLLLSEATIQGWQKLNKFRQEWKLDTIPMPSFNSYLDQEKVIKEIPSSLRFVELVDFSSSYFVGTRVLKPLIAKTLGINIDIANPDMEWNHWFANMPPVGDFGTQKLFIFEKK